MKKAILYTIMFVLLQLAVQFIVSMGWTLCCPPAGSYENFAEQLTAVGMQPATLVTATIAFNVVAAALYLLLRWTPVSNSYVKTHPWSVFAWCIVASVGTLIPSMYLQELMPELPDTLSEQLLRMMQVPGCFVAIAVLAPVAEEVVFRGAVLRSLLRWMDPMPVRRCEHDVAEGRGAGGRRLSALQWGAVALSALFFALVHGNPAQMPHAFLVGLLLGWLFARTGSVLPGIVLHVANNTIAYLLAAAYPAPDMRLVDMLGGEERTVVYALIFSLMLLLPALYQLHLRMRHA